MEDEEEEAAGEVEVDGVEEVEEVGEMVGGAKADVEEATVEAREAVTSIKSPVWMVLI